MTKKLLGMFGAFCLVFMLAACSKNVTVDDLKANDWIVKGQDDEVNMIVSFSDHVMTMSVDASGLKSTAENEWEALGEELGTALVNSMEFKLEYELKGDQAKIEDPDTNKFLEYTVSREDDKIIFTPNDNKEKENFVLEKYTKSKTEKSTSTKESKIKDSTSNSSSSEVSESSSNTVAAIESSTQEYEEPVATIDDFYGLWGVPNSGNLIQVNQDYTVTTVDGSTIPMINTTFSENPSGQAVMNFTLNGVPKQMTLLSSNQLLADGTVYTFQGHMTMSELSARNNANAQAATQQKTTNQSQTTTTVLQGESPEQIASRNGISVDQLLSLNGMTKDNYFFAPGQQVKIK